MKLVHLGLRAAMIACLTAAVAQAQYSEYQLGPNGEWVQTAAPDPNSPEGIIANAREFLAQDKPEPALNLLDNWIKEIERTGSPYLPEALALRGDAWTASGDEYQALYDYERLIKEFPGSDQYIVAVERELDIGIRYLNGYSRKFLGLRILNAEDVGQELLIRVGERMPGSRLGERAGIELADYYYRIHDLSLATEAYDLFLKNYPSSQYTMKAMQRRVYSTIGKYKGPKYDGSALLDSSILIRRFNAMYAQQAAQAGLDEALLARIDESAATEMYESARWYLKQGDEPSARYLLMRLIRERPKTAAAGDAYKYLESRRWLPASAKQPNSDSGQDNLEQNMEQPNAVSASITDAPASSADTTERPEPDSPSDAPSNEPSPEMNK